MCISFESVLMLFIEKFSKLVQVHACRNYSLPNLACFLRYLQCTESVCLHTFFWFIS